MRAPRTITIAATAIATLVLALAASAAMDDNTVVNLGYDETSHFFFWNVTSLDYEPFLDAVEADEAVSEADLETLLALCGIAPEGSETELKYSFDGETLSLFNPDGTPLENGACGPFTGADVTGPAGQVNHGMFMKLFNSLYEGSHRGCVARVLAQSGLGKADQQVRPGDETSGDEEPEDEIVDGSATVETATTKCKVDDEDKGGGPPDHVLEKFGEDHPKNRENKGKPAGTPGGRP